MSICSLYVLEASCYVTRYVSESNRHPECRCSNKMGRRRGFMLLAPTVWTPPFHLMLCLFLLCRQEPSLDDVLVVVVAMLFGFSSISLSGLDAFWPQGGPRL